MPLKLGVRLKNNQSELGTKLPFPGKGHKVSDSPPTPDPPTISVPLSPEPQQDQQIPSPEIPGPAAPFEGFANPGTALCPPKESPASSTRSSPDRSGNGTARINMTPPPLPADECIPLLPSEGARSRRSKMPRYEPTDWDDSLPYGGKVYLARKKKPDSWPCIALQVALVLFAVGMMYYGWYHTEHLHFHATKLYGHYGHPVAQAMTAEKYLHGKGVEKNHTLAMEWYKKAALQGHPHASYNLAVGHLQGMDVGLKPGEVHELIKHAAAQGVIEAADVLLKACSKGRCDD